MSPNENKPTFDGMGIAPGFLEVLHELKFTEPTPIQQKSIPVALEGKDLIGIAETGTGKTLAFGIPMIQQLFQGTGQGIVILPTRELAMQVNESLQKVGGVFGLRTSILIGGAPQNPQINSLRRNPHIIVGTPGRIVDLMQQKQLILNKVRILVLDEADRMLDMGFAPQLNRILGVLPKERQTMLFSATMPNEIVRIAQASMKLPVRVEIAPAGSTSKKVSQEIFFVRREAKNRLLDKLLGEYKGSVLVFSRTKFGATRIMRAIKNMGHTAAEIHSDRSMSQRRQALEGFKNGAFRVLVATDIAARGIDVKGIELVINYDLPDDSEDYVHRIGRTGRAGHEGHAISFATPDQVRDVRNIERVIKMNLPQSKLPELPPERAVDKSTQFISQERPRGGHSRFGGGGPRKPYQGNRPTRFNRFNSGAKPNTGFGNSQFKNRNSNYRGFRPR